MESTAQATVARRAFSQALRVHLAMLAALPALASGADRVEERAQRPSVRAAAVAGPVDVDGKLDEPAWQSAEPFEDLVQLFPEEGGSPTEATEVRVLHDDTTLYVGITCHDSRPADILRPLGRRDAPPASDLVRVYVGSSGDRRTAQMFVVTAGGVIADAVVYDDDQITYDWDAVWEGAAALLPDGWSAELAIPLAILSYPSSPDQAWTFGVQREMGRSHERSATMMIPRNARGLASRLGSLAGLEGLEPGPDIEIAPYTTGRISARPRYSDPATPRPRDAALVADAGVDFRLRFGPRLDVSGTVNPDFGQVEADEVILNLSNVEYRFPEKRPFFTHGLDLFKSVGDGNEQVPHQILYSRRIGLDVPILGAVKLVGRAGDRIRIGMLDAFVSGTEQRAGATEAAPDRSLRWTPAQPFQLAPGLAYPFDAAAPRNFLAAVVRASVSPGVLVGAIATSVLPVGPVCTAADAANPAGPHARCAVRGGNALALDFNAASPEREWYAYGQVEGSQVLAGPPSRILADGITLSRGDLGVGGYLRAGRRGGEPWRFDLGWAYASPRLDLDAAGYLRVQNLQKAHFVLKYGRPSGGGPLHEWAVWLNGWSQWATDGSGLSRGYGVVGGVDALLKRPYLGVHCQLDYAEARWDIRDVKRGRGSPEGAGVPEEWPGFVTPSCTVDTDAARRLSASLFAYVGRVVSAGPLREPWSNGVTASAAWRPHPRTETKLAVVWDYTVLPVKYVDGMAPGPLLIGGIAVPSLSVTLRETFVATPGLTFQLYAQLFAANVKYGPFYSAPAGTSPVRIRDLRPVDPWTDAAFAPFTDPDSKEVTVVANAVVRWEYRPGWIVYLLYARNQKAQPWWEGDPQRHSILPDRLGLGPTTDTVSIKLTYFFRV